MDENEWLADRFEEHRAHLRAVAYRMLGSLTRGRRRRPGHLAAPQPGRGERGREPRRVADHDRRPRLPEHAAVAQHATRGVPRRAPARPGHQPAEGRLQPGGGSVAGRLGRARPARRARHPDPGGAARVRAPRHVRAALRGDRSHGRSLPGGSETARQPGPAPGQGRRAYRLPTPISLVSERWSTPSSRPRAGATSTPSSRCSIPTSCCDPTSAPGAPPPRW